MFICVVYQKPVNKLDLTWKQSFLILVDNEILGRCSLYQFEIDSEDSERTFTCYFINSTP